MVRVVWIKNPESKQLPPNVPLPSPAQLLPLPHSPGSPHAPGGGKCQGAGCVLWAKGSHGCGPVPGGGTTGEDHLAAPRQQHPPPSGLVALSRVLSCPPYPEEGTRML